MPETKPAFNIKTLSEQDQKDFLFVQKRIDQLKKARKEEQFGVELETIWADADRDYAPHRLRQTEKRGLIEDETKGWRGTSTITQLGGTNWQSDISQANPYIKIQVALSILIDQNPSGIFTATKKQYQATTELMKQLYNRSWEFAKSKQQSQMPSW